MAPTGTVTFLFTDLQGSTRAWEDHPDEMRRAVARHDEILRAAIAGRGGYVFATGGDAFSAAFATAADAARCAVDAQRALRAETWPAPVTLRSRMGLHTGVAHERDDNYFGPVVNRAARIMSAAHGGQVLLSAVSASLLGRDHFAVAELGEVRLRDLLEPERLYQLVVDGDEGAYPPPNALDRFDTNLPVVPTAIIGRRAEAEEVRSLLTEHSIVTLTGVGGVGKTRLALEVAAQELGPRGVHFVDLSPVSDPDQVAAAVLSALDVPAAGAPEAALGTLKKVLGKFPALVVLDNCEHLLDPVAELVDSIVASCPKCRILATSREPLGVEGERVWRAPPLDDETAAQLFGERAMAVNAGVQLPAGRVRELCRSLDGIPLAIELAAARVSHLTVDEIVAHLDERFDLLTGGRRRARQRHQTLEATMDWSYELLSASEQSVLRACAVFTGGFTVPSLAAVAGLDPSRTRNLVGALVDKSLVTVSPTSRGTTRYRLLETVRLYAQAKGVAVGDIAGARERHAAHFVALARDGRRHLAGWAMEAGVFDAVDEDLDNFVAAAEWADETGGVSDLAAIVSFLAVTRLWADPSWRFLDRPEVEAALDDDGRSYYLVAGATNANLVGDFLRQIALGRRAVGGPIHDPAVGLLAYSILANAEGIFDASAAEAVIEEGTARFGTDHPVYGSLFARLVDLAILRGDLVSAAELMHSPDYGEPGMGDLPLVLLLLGRDDEAMSVLDRPPAGPFAMDWWRTYRKSVVQAIVEAKRGRHREATRVLAAAQREIDRRPMALIGRDILIAAAALAYHRGDPRRAAVLLAVERRDLFVRTPGSWALYLHYRGLTRAALDRAAVEAAKVESDRYTIASAVAEELAAVR